MRARELLFALTSALFLSHATPAEAQCLPSALRPALRAQLLAQLRASRATPAELYRHAHDRLGFGTATHRAGALPPTTGDALEALADRILDELAAADTIHTGADNLLAAIARTSTPAGALDLSTRPYHHAASDMSGSYSELIRYSREMTTLRRQIDALPPGAQRDRLQARYDGLRRSAQITRSDIRDSAVVRAVSHAVLSSNADVGALLTEFWSNHFNVDSEKSTWASVDYRKMIQRRMCGRLDTLLTAVAKHPAMAIYLDNFRSRVGAINENYARELMELHTFGDDLYRYYQQPDVVGVARVLSGWSVAFDEPTPGVLRPVFRFYPGAHDNVQLTLFGGAPRGVPLTLAPIAGDAGVRRGEQLLAYLASHVATRRNLCGKLSRKLIGDAPVALIDECASDAVWGAGGDLGNIYRFFLVRPELWQASLADDTRVPGHRYVMKDKTPLELVASAYRAVALPNTALNQPWFVNTMNGLRSFGLLPGRTPPPTGYPEGNVWASSGLLLTWTPYLFARVPTDALWFRNGATTLRGAALEAHFAALVRAAPDAAAQRALGATIADQVVRYPGLRLASDTIYPALVEADTLRADRSVAPVRSYVHALLAHGDFLRK
jgi:uncharacterized protein (DUF1800 family)